MSDPKRSIHDSPQRAPGVARTSCMSAALALVCCAPAWAVISNVDDAADVCDPGADPCVISELVQVVSGAELDFGVRAVRVAPGGRIEIGAGTALIRCGSFTAATPGSVAILARGRVAGSGQVGGSLQIESRGTCEKNRFVACFFEGQCGTGPCDGGRCASAPDALCDDNVDCDFGGCSKGAGVSIAGAIEAQGVSSGSVSILAAGDITLSDVIDLDSTVADGDGGQFDATSTLGSMSIPGRIEATSGRLGFGGSVLLSAAQHVTVNGLIDVSGGDFDGGELDVIAGGDIAVAGRLHADSTGGEGAGGFIGLDTAGDLHLYPTAQLSAHGHRSAENFGGDGGTIVLLALGGVTIEAGSSVAADGAQPDGFAGDVDVAAEADVVIAGTVAVKARGSQGAGGGIDVLGCAVEITSAGTIENGGEGGENAITARTSLRARPGSKILADENTGSNQIFYRDAANPPVLQGIVDPVPSIHLALDLPECIRCGNGIVETGETCDDENVIGGDGCSADCQDEKCIADTPGYPDVDLCNDGNECTADTCVAGVGCARDPVQGPCDDGVSCTDRDACVNGRCRGVSTCEDGFFCSSVAQECVAGTTTTTTTLPGVCGDGVVDADEDCDDGDTVFLRGQACTADCTWVACGDPDGSGTVTASDALILLRVAVGLETCVGCVCDVDGSSGPPGASDALRTLSFAVGLPVELRCPPCSNS